MGIHDNNMTFTPIAPLNFEALLTPEPSTCTTVPLAPAQCGSYNQKTIQELFTLDYGRMNATLGTELPLTNFQNQTTIPLGYVDPATEIIRQGDTQLWKITHNGVDTHFIHFHLFNVQVVNRVGWDGSVRQPDANELGWKDTVRMNPLEDIMVALQPITPTTPWPVPNSVRLNDITGQTMNFANLNPFNNGPLPTSDKDTNFGWEYVWHCHILGHEENDMMRPILWQVPPRDPTNLAAVLNGAGADVSFVDGSASETGFTVQRDVNPNFTAPTTIAVGPSPSLNAVGEGVDYGSTITIHDPGPLTFGSTYYYRIQAVDNGFTGASEQSYNSTSAVVSNWVGPLTFVAAVTTNMTITAPAINYGQDGIVTVNVLATGGAVPTGNVTLTVDGGAATAAALANGSAIFTITKPTAGSHALVASYAAQDGFSASSATGTLIVNRLAASVTPNAATKVFGAPDPVLSGTLSGFLAADGVTATYTRTLGEAVGTYTISATLAPAGVLANYNITSNTAAFTITSGGPALGLSPLSLTFSSPLNVTSASQPVLVSNTGTGALILTSINFGGASPGRFGQTNNCPIRGAGLAAGTSCTVNVVFTPNSTATRTATLRVNVSAPAVSGTVSLTGTTVLPTVSVSPAAVPFGPQPINTTSVAQTVTFTNTGTVPVVISGISLGGANPARFAIANNACPIGGTGVAVGGSCTVSVTFTPTRRVNSSATLTFRDNASPGFQVVTLTGSGQ
jgi:hypothetical protein